MKKLLSVLATFAIAGCLTLSAQAPPPDQQKKPGTPEQSADRDAGKEQSITGCLAKGDAAGQFTLTSGSRKVNISGAAADLEKNVGKTVKVTGTRSADGVNATKVEMVSDTCAAQ